MTPHLSQLNVAMDHRNCFRQNLQILKLATHIKIEDHYSRCKLETDWKTTLRRWVFRFRFFAVFRGSCLATSNEKPECEKNLGFLCQCKRL